MKKYISIKKERIGAVSIFFALFAALMLVQTPYMNLGTIIAFISIFLIVTTFFATHNKLVLSNANLLLFSFMILLFLRSAIIFQVVSYRLIAQGIMCVFLISYKSNPRESKFLERVIALASVIYAVLTIISSAKSASDTYVHGGIELFGTVFDPNFIGIPLVMGGALILNNIIEHKNLLLSFAALFVLLIAIFYTSSRGNTVTIFAVFALELTMYIFKKKTSLTKKTFAVVISLAFFIFAYKLLSNNMADQWDRMTNFSEGSDNGRFALWGRAIDLWLDNPLFGVGNGGFYSSVGMATHNTYLTVLAENGFVGAFIFFGFLFCMIKKAWQCGAGIFAMLFAVLLHAFFVDALDNRCVWVAISFIGFYSLPKVEEIV